MKFETALLWITLISLGIVSVTLVYIVYLHQASRKMAKSLDDVIDNYLKK